KLNDPVDRFCGSFKLYINGQPIKHTQCWMALALKEGKEFTGKEIVIERPDGTRITALSHANPIHDELGRIIGAINVLIDITDRKRLENALKESEQRFFGLFKQASVGIAQFDLNGKFVMVNDRYCEIAGRTAGELTNMDLFNKLVTDGKEYLIDKRYIRPDGSYVWVRKSVTLIKDEKGNPEYVA